MDNESLATPLACRVTDFNVLPLGALIFLAAANPRLQSSRIRQLSVLSCVGVRKLLFITKDLLASFRRTPVFEGFGSTS